MLIEKSEHVIWLARLLLRLPTAHTMFPNPPSVSESCLVAET
jgi:hypothetical protein